MLTISDAKALPKLEFMSMLMNIHEKTMVSLLESNSFQADVASLCH